MCERMDFAGAWKAWIIVALKTWNCLLLLWFSKDDNWSASDLELFVSYLQKRSGAKSCSVNFAWGVDKCLDLILVSIKKKDQAQLVLPTCVTVVTVQ